MSMSISISILMSEGSRSGQKIFPPWMTTLVSPRIQTPSAPTVIIISCCYHD